MAAEYLERMGARIREAREAKELSQSALARLLPGTTDGNQVSRWELGKHRPSDDTLEALAVALDVDVTYFLAAQPEAGGQTPDPFRQSVSNDIEARLERIEALLEEARIDRGRIEEAITAQQGILEELQRVAKGLPGDEALELVSRAAQTVRERAEAAEAARGETQGTAPGTRRRRATGQ